MSEHLFSIWQNVNKDSFYLEISNVKYRKEDIDSFIKKLEKNLNDTAYWKDEKVIVDVKDRRLFIVVFLTLLRLKSKIVLVPAEIKQEDYIGERAVLLSDNKKFENGLYVNDDLSITIGQNFNAFKHKENDIIKSDASIFLYTSGSTGKAKLIPKTYENLITELKELKQIFDIQEDARFYATPPLYHIYGLLFGFLLPLYSSCKIIADYHFTPESIADFVESKKISHFISIPSYYKMFCKLGLVSVFNYCDKLVSSSAPLPVDVSQLFYSSGAKIVEVYGSTETGGIAYRTSATSLEWAVFSYVNIIANYDKYLRNDEEVIKEIELQVTSPTISVEYNHALGFNTGDVVDLYSNSLFRLLGRNTRFVKISGKRVDLNYVVEKVREYLIDLSGAHISEDALYAGCQNEKIYIISEVELHKTSKELKDALKKHLPGYAVPRIYISAEIPRNKMGKINKVKILEMVAKHTRYS